MGNTWYMMTISYLTAPLACVAICVSGYFIAQRLCPNVLGLLVGVRK